MCHLSVSTFTSLSVSVGLKLLKVQCKAVYVFRCVFALTGNNMQGSITQRATLRQRAFIFSGVEILGKQLDANIDNCCKCGLSFSFLDY